MNIAIGRQTGEAGKVSNFIAYYLLIVVRGPHLTPKRDESASGGRLLAQFGMKLNRTSITARYARKATS